MIILGVVIYNDLKFRNNPLSPELLQKTNNKKYHLQQLIRQKYGINFDAPVLISDKMPNNLFGVAIYTHKKEIKVVLNKKRYQESGEYMIDYVLPHEYAHAFMFELGKFRQENGGHTLEWQKICLALEGKKCDRYVKHNDILFGKVPFLK
jgi:hypothetical protein